MDFEVIFPNVVGLDVHLDQITACAISVRAEGEAESQFKVFGATKAERRKLSAWVRRHKADLVVMESTGVYWKSVYRSLEGAGLKVSVVNARHIKNVPGRKTDMADSLWLAMLGRAGLLRGSFVISADLDALRLISRQRQQLAGLLASEKNRFRKVLADSGIRLSCVVSDLHGQAARRMEWLSDCGRWSRRRLGLVWSTPQSQPGAVEGSLGGRTDRRPPLCVARDQGAYP